MTAKVIPILHGVYRRVSKSIAKGGRVAYFDKPPTEEAFDLRMWVLEQFAEASRKRSA